MQEGLTVEGLAQQARRVAEARWPGLLITAGLWGLAAWLAVRLPAMAMANGWGYDGGSQGMMMTLASLPGTVGGAVMLSVVVRTGQPGRSPAAIAWHGLVAILTLVVVEAVVGVGSSVLGMLAYETAASEHWISYITAFLPAAFQYGAFAFLGMMLPAALERPVAPTTAAGVALRLGRGRRLWLAMIALVWSVAMSVPVRALDLFGLQNGAWGMPARLLGAVLTVLGIGVLYLELRRLHAGGQAEGVSAAHDEEARR